MNGYLLMLGGNFPEIRKILNLTQEDLANKMGVSRPTIVKIEQDPSKLTKAISYAFFVCITYEINRRIREIGNIKPQDYANLENLDRFIAKLRATSYISGGALVTLTTMVIGPIVPGISKILTKGIKEGWDSFKRDSLHPLQNGIKWSEDKPQKVIDAVHKKLIEDQKKLQLCFQIHSLAIDQFVEKLEEGDSKDNIW
jgi:DNA-binding XRE family transcriptional regulator